MADVDRTAVSVEVTKVRNAYLPVVSGNCLKIDSADDYITPSSAFLWTNRWSCFFKAKVLSTPSNGARLISNDSETILLTVTGIQVTQGGATVVSSSVLIYNEWHDYGIVYDGSFMRFYRDGCPISAKSITTNPSTNNWAYTIFNNPAHNRHCDMSVAYFQFYTKAFTPEQVVAHYFNNSKDTASLKLEYRLNEGTGTTATDSSGNGNNGTITNCSWDKFYVPSSLFSYGETSII